MFSSCSHRIALCEYSVRTVLAIEKASLAKTECSHMLVYCCVL